MNIQLLDKFLVLKWCY